MLATHFQNYFFDLGEKVGLRFVRAERDKLKHEDVQSVPLGSSAPLFLFYLVGALRSRIDMHGHTAHRQAKRDVHHMRANCRDRRLGIRERQHSLPLAQDGELKEKVDGPIIPDIKANIDKYAPVLTKE
eukprot:3972800-Prymnesium_polylepis.1